MQIAYTPALVAGQPIRGMSKHSDGYLYVAQPDAVKPYPTLTISRLDDTGAAVDRMVIPEACEGTFISIEDRSGQPWVWTSMEAFDSGNIGITAPQGGTGGLTSPTQMIVRFPYQAGSFTRTQLKDAGLVIAYAGSTVVGLIFNSKDSKALRVDVGSGYTAFSQVDKAAALAGTSIFNGSALYTYGSFRGACAADAILFTLTGAISLEGAPTSPTDPPLMQEWSFETGQVMQNYDLSDFGKSGGVYIGGARDLGSITMDYVGGNPHPMIGVNNGPTNNRSWLVYADDLDALNRIVGYDWDFGDGTAGQGLQVHHIYAKGNWTATLTITDKHGIKSSKSHQVTI